MKDSELEAMAERLNIPAQDIARWHIIHSPRFLSKNPGRPKGKQKRPNGTLAIADIVRQYGIDHTTLQQWREQGMPHEVRGKMILIQERVLNQWIDDRWGKDEGAESL
jgi:hypothetical protein